LETSKSHEDIPDEIVEANMTLEDEVWQMFFDGTSRMGHKDKIIAGVEVVLSHHTIIFFLVLSH